LKLLIYLNSLLKAIYKFIVNKGFAVCQGKLEYDRKL